MSENASPFASLMHLVAQGDRQATAQLLHQYGDTLIAFIRMHLRRRDRLRSIFDSDWFANGVWADLLCDPAKCQQFATPDQFVRYLLVMARNQICNASRDYLDTQKRDLRRSRYFSDPAVSAAASVVADPHPSPAQQAEYVDGWDRWLGSLSAQEQQFILLRRAGFTFSEIAAELGCSLRSLERLVDDLRRDPPPEPILAV